MAFDNLPPDPKESQPEGRAPQWHRPVNADQPGRLPDGFGVSPAVHPGDTALRPVEQLPPAPWPPAAQVTPQGWAPPGSVMPWPPAADAGNEQARQGWRTFWQRKAPALAAATLLVAGLMAGSGVTYTVMQARGIHPYYVKQGTTAQATGHTVAFADSGQTAAQIYQNVAPSVVRITQTAKVNAMNFFGGLEQQDETGIGTGIVLDDQGHILTNDHVIAEGGKITVEFLNGKKVEGTVIGTDPGDDLALVKVDPQGLDLHPAVLGDSDQMQEGDGVLAIGNPFGEYGWSVSSGLISGKNRPLQTDSGRTVRGLLQTDAAINPGNSGGPLANMQGQVIGINTAIQSPVKGSVGIGFAIPVNLVKEMLPDLTKGAQVKHAWVGVGLALVKDHPKVQFGIDHGVFLTDVYNNSPADAAGLVPTVQTKSGRFVAGDVITGVDKVTVNQPDDLINYVNGKHVGDTLTLHIWRNGKMTDIPLTLGAWPDKLDNSQQ